MFPLDPTIPLNRLVREAPEAILLLKELEVDEDAGMSLEELSRMRGFLPGEIERTWEELSRKMGFQDETTLRGYGVPELIGYIFFMHHNSLEKGVPRLKELWERAVSQDGPAHPELLEMEPFLKEFIESTLWHMKEEETILFPFFLFLSKPGNEGSLGMAERENLMNIFEMENEKIHDALEFLRLKTRNYHVPSDAGPAYRELGMALARMEFELRRHARVENHLLLPKVLERQSGPPLPAPDPDLHFREAGKP